MYSVNALLGSGVRQDLLLLASLLKRFPSGQVIQLCPTSTTIKSSPKEDPIIPPLPVQPLEQMLNKYLRTIKPFVDPLQFEKTKELTRQFCEDENLGKKLQKLLEERAKNTKNWLADWWLNTAYLENRNPLIVYSSPGLVWPKQYFSNLKEQLLYTAHVIAAALDFNAIVEQKKIPQETLGMNNFLCMSQYGRIFGTCRIPKLERDELLFQDLKNPSHNIVVMYNNHFFNLPAFEVGTRKPLSMNCFYAMLLDIVKQGDDAPGPPIGVLTTENRNNWANSYEKLKHNQLNKRFLESYIEKALFIVCIDKPLTLGSGLNYNTRCSKLLLHGFGMRGNVGNRWYDKTIQFVIGAEDDGIGIAYEHSPAEGGPIGVLTDHVLQNLKELDVRVMNDLELPDTYPKPEKLEFVLSDSIEQAIESAGKAVDRMNDELDVFSWSFTDFGKTTLKKLNVSPDSFIQIAIQYAFYQIHKHPGAQYESGTLRKYEEGRTDTIRTCSEEVVKFCQVMTNEHSTAYNKESALRDALASHKAYAREVIEGRGIDRHLLGLKILAKMNKIEDAKIFSDIAYQRSAYFQLSTSNVPTKCDGFMVYGPLVDDGYACCYNPRDENINFGMSAWSNCKVTRLIGFKRALQNALLEMVDFLKAAEKSVKSKL